MYELYCTFPLQRALRTETKVESGTSQRKSGTSLNLSNSGILGRSPNVRNLLHIIFRTRLFDRGVVSFALYAGNSRVFI